MIALIIWTLFKGATLVGYLGLLWESTQRAMDYKASKPFGAWCVVRKLRYCYWVAGVPLFTALALLLLIGSTQQIVGTMACFGIWIGAMPALPSSAPEWDRGGRKVARTIFYWFIALAQLHFCARFAWGG